MSPNVALSLSMTYTNQWQHHYTHTVRNATITSTKRKQPRGVGCGQFVGVPVVIA